MSRNTVRKLLRSGKTSFSFERLIQPGPKLVRWASKFTLALTVCLVNSPALSRAASHQGTTTCEGPIKQVGDPGWYEIDVCSFDGSTHAGKIILATCSEGDPCQIKAYGEWAPDFYVKRLISVHRLDRKALNEMPEEFQATWTLYHADKDVGLDRNRENQMPVGTKGIGWQKDPCSVTAVGRNQGATVVKQVCGGREVTELWSLRKLNGSEMLIVARIGPSSKASSPDVSIYVRDAKPR
jgi:hypothetical protein